MLRKRFVFIVVGIATNMYELNYILLFEKSKLLASRLFFQCGHDNQIFGIRTSINNNISTMVYAINKTCSVFSNQSYLTVTY